MSDLQTPPPEPIEHAGPESPPPDESAVDREMARLTRRSLLIGGAAALAGAGAWEWLRTRRLDEGVPWPLRLGLRADEQLSRDYFRESRLTRTFPPSAIDEPRQNGDIGLDDDVDPNRKLTVEGAAQPLALTMDEIKTLPKVEMITELKCIEGWSRVIKWGGVRFRDFAAKYAPARTDPNSYVSLQTPDNKYYVGLDLASALHPQTLLCYEMNGEPLPDEHGAPLRLVIPVKYGIKNLKRIGTIAFSNTRPPDFWAERGYDWYAGF